MSTKTYSNLQEKRIADYLGWDVVSGSGARDFHPGDIVAEDWLGECKTHTKLQDNVVFYRKHWDKIVSEAVSCSRYPALFVDNGSQRVEDTLVMISSLHFPDNSHTVAIPKVIKQSVNIHVPLVDFLVMYTQLCRQKDDMNILISAVFENGSSVYLSSLRKFSEMFHFESR